MSTDGFSAKSDNDEADPYSKTEIRFVIDRNINEQLILGATALYSDEEIDYDGFTHETDHIDRTDQPEVSMHLLTQDPLQIKLQDLFQKLIGTILTDGTRASSETEMYGITQDRPF